MRSKLVPIVLVIVGVVFLLLSVTNVSMFQYATSGSGGGTGTTGTTGSSTGGTGSTTTYYSWTLSGTIGATPLIVTAGNHVDLTVDITAYYSTSSSGTTLGYFIGTTQIGSVSVSGTGSHEFTWTPEKTGNYTYTAAYISTSSSSNSYVSITGSKTITVNGDTPSIDSVSASPSSIYVGQSTTFSATVNWHGTVGEVTWQVSPGTTVSSTGTTYTFVSAGTYTITATATNIYGSSNPTSFSLVVATQPVVPPPVIQHIGNFFIETPSGSFIQLSATSNIVFNFANYPASLTVLYVEDNGTTTNFTGASVTLNSNTPISLTNQTTYDGDIAFGGQILFGSSGTYTITGNIQGTGSIGNVQIFSIGGTLGNKQTTITSSSTPFNIPDLGVSLIFFAIAGYVLWRKH